MPVASSSLTIPLSMQIIHALENVIIAWARKLPCATASGCKGTYGGGEEYLGFESCIVMLAKHSCGPMGKHLCNVCKGFAQGFGFIQKAA